ncbi:uncharacterized protein M6G45_014765 isoform 2-T2 [Spheniscus humboldti]
MLRPLRMMPILLSGPRVWFAKFRYWWEVVAIFLLDVWAGLTRGVGSLVPAQGKEGTLAAPVAGEAHDGAWTGLCFGEGEVPLWVTAPSTFSSCSHLNRVVFSRRWRPPSSTRLPQAPLSYCWSPKLPGNQSSWPVPTRPGRTGRLPAPASPSAPCRLYRRWWEQLSSEETSLCCLLAWPRSPHNVRVLNLGKPLEKAEQPALPGEQNPHAGGQAGLTTA